MDPSLEMSIYDFFIYMTKTKKIYIDINVFKEQLQIIRQREIYTVEDLLKYDRDALRADLKFNKEMVHEVNSVSIQLTGDNLGDISTERSDAHTIDQELNPFEPELAEDPNRQKKKMAIIAVLVLVVISIIVVLSLSGVVEIPKSMGEKMDDLYKAEPVIKHDEGAHGVESSTFWDWQVNTNKWDLLETYEKTTLAYELKHNKYVIKLDPIMESHLKFEPKMHTKIGRCAGIYTGQTLDGLPHGNGRYTNDWGEIWEG